MNFSSLCGSITRINDLGSTLVGFEVTISDPLNPGKDTNIVVCTSKINVNPENVVGPNKKYLFSNIRFTSFLFEMYTDAASTEFDIMKLNILRCSGDSWKPVGSNSLTNNIYSIGDGCFVNDINNFAEVPGAPPSYFIGAKFLYNNEYYCFIRFFQLSEPVLVKLKNHQTYDMAIEKYQKTKKYADFIGSFVIFPKSEHTSFGRHGLVGDFT